MMLPLLVGAAGSLLLADGLWLMLQDKINFGTVLPTLIGSALLLWALKRRTWQAVIGRSMVRRRLWGLTVAGFALWLLSLLLFFVWLGTRQPAAPSTAPSMIVSLGSGLMNSQPTPTLAARLDQVLRLSQQHPSAQVMTTGGTSRGQTLSEAQAMADYLTRKGLAPQRLLLETRSTSTHENLLFVRQLLPPNTAILITSSDFHLPRAEKIAQRLQLNVVGTSPAPTPLNIRYNAWLREYFAYISGWLLGEY